MNHSTAGTAQLVQPSLARAGAYLVSRPMPIVALMLGLGLAIRLWAIEGAPLDFHATRQYRSLIIARGFFFDASSSVPEWQRQVSAASVSNQGLFEPPIMEFFISIGYGLLGAEQLWLPALASSIFWLIGGVFVYLIVRRIVGITGALFGLAFYLFLPFAVVASRSFQPDPLMVMLMLASVWALSRHFEAPSTQRLLGAALLAALAALVHPRSAFIILAVFVALAYFSRDSRQPVRLLEGTLYGAIMMAPALIVYGYTMLTGQFQAADAQANVRPDLLLSPFFWRGWLDNVSATVGLLPFFVGLLGLFLFRRGLPQMLVLGMWIGYVGLALVYNYAIATHDYDHLQLVPIVAISAAPICALVLLRIADLQPGLPGRLAVAGVLCAALLLVLVDARARIDNPDWRTRVAVKEEIGAAVGHSTQTIFLSSDYGVSLEYHGLLAGQPWPIASDLEWEELTGVPVLSAEERFRNHYADSGADHFIVEDHVEFDQQPDLQAFLAHNFPVLASAEDYVIYDIRQGYEP